MKLRFTVTAESPQRIEVDPADFVGMSESEVWGRITDSLFDQAVFSVETIERDADTFTEAWRDADRAAPKCGICHDSFNINANVVLAHDGKTKVHFRCLDRRKRPGQTPRT